MTEPAHYQTFMCRCRPPAAQECEAVWAKVRQYWNDDDLAGLLTTICMSLDQDFGVTWHYASDMWGVVRGESRDKTFSFAVQCDLITDGLAAAWVWCTENQESQGTLYSREE